jgi:hypothetical protein
VATDITGPDAASAGKSASAGPDAASAGKSALAGADAASAGESASAGSPRHLAAPAPRRGIMGVVRLRRPGRGAEADADLDDLFSYDEAEEPSGPPRFDSRPWVVISILQTFAASAVVYTGFRALDLAASYAVIVAVCAGLVLVRQAVLVTREPRWQRTRDLVRAHAPGLAESSEDGDGMLNAIGRWDRRLDWGTTTGERFTSAVGRRIGELADERLRQRHGLTRASDPARALELLGADAWALIHGQVGGSPQPALVARALARIEAL